MSSPATVTPGRSVCTPTVADSMNSRPKEYSMNCFFSLRRITVALFALGMIGLAIPAQASGPVPFKGVARVVITSSEPADDGVHLTTTGGGQATHLGRYTREECVILHDDFSLEAWLTFKAANGDLLYVSATGGFTSPTTAAGA